MIPWERYMDIFALRRQGFSFRSIAKKLGIHRNTVKKYLLQEKPPQYTKGTKRASIVEPYMQLIDEWLQQDNYQASWIFNQIKKLGYGGGYDTVRHYVGKIKEHQRRRAYIRFETLPGLQAQMDWADFQVNELNGSSTTVYLFLLVLGFSRAMYAELVASCTLQLFMDAHIRAFHYLGGIPMEILYDNMRNVVIGRSHGKAEFNVEFSHFAHHYAFKPVPCPPYSPWQKGKVERPVEYVRESFWRGYRFTTIEQANCDLQEWLKTTANCRVHGTHGQVVNERWQQELPSLSKCPRTEYDTSLKVYRKVYKDCMISYNASHYQVPPDVVGKKVLLKIKDGLIRFYDDDRLLASYRIAQQKNSFITDAKIMDQIRLQRKQIESKYGYAKGKATRGLVNGSLFPQVHYRPLSVYDQFAQGGGQWTN